MGPRRRRPPRPRQPPRLPEKPAPPPASKVSWAGFSDPALIARDRLQKIGEEFAAFVDKNHQPPATLAEAGMAEAESAEYSYVGAEIAALPRFLRHRVRSQSVGVLRTLCALQRRQRAAGCRRAGPLRPAQKDRVRLGNGRRRRPAGADGAGDSRDEPPLCIAGSGPRRQARRRRSSRRRVRHPGRRRLSSDHPHGRRTERDLPGGPQARCRLCLRSPVAGRSRVDSNAAIPLGPDGAARGAAAAGRARGAARADPETVPAAPESAALAALAIRDRQERKLCGQDAQGS